MVNEQRADRQFGNLKMLGNVLLIFYRVVVTESLVYRFEGAQKLGSK